jgi:CRP/FNR family transcriptional regulator
MMPDDHRHATGDGPAWHGRRHEAKGAVVAMARERVQPTTTTLSAGKQTMRALLMHPKSPYRLPLPAVEALVAAAQLNDWRAGRPLYAPHEHSDFVHFLVNGTIRVEVPAGRGRWSIAAFVPCGRFVSSLLPLPAEGCQFRVIPHTSVLVGTVTRFALQHIVEGLPYDRALAFMARDTNSSRRLLADRCSLAWAQTPKRISHALRRLAQDFGRPHGEWTQIDLQVTHAEIARLIGASRANVSRTLRRLQRTGEIDVRSRRILVRTDDDSNDTQKRS